MNLWTVQDRERQDDGTELVARSFAFAEPDLARQCFADVLHEAGRTTAARVVLIPPGDPVPDVGSTLPGRSCAA